MSFVIRNYQQRAIDSLYAWWMAHQRDQIPLLVLPTGAGKSIVIAELVRLLWDTWPEDAPRTVVLVPSKELAEQNADKLARVMPSHRSVGLYSASLGRRDQHADVIVATIGSIYRNAHTLGAIRCVLIDEAHLVNPNGVGRFRQFVDDLSKYNELAIAGLTATPFRGDGVWLTDGASPLFSGIACEVKPAELLDAGHLAPLVRPIDVIDIRIDTDGISTASGDYKLDDLAERVEHYLPAIALDVMRLAAERKKWIAFTPTVANAQTLVALLTAQGVAVALVCGETDKHDREQRIADFRAGRLRCLVTVLALATGFDVPDVDAIIWCRPTQSPVLYVQGAGRGMRPADGKTDCLWLDYSDTTERLGPVDMIRGRKKRKGPTDPQAPFALCGECGAQVRPASAMFCTECGHQLREDEEQLAREVSAAPILASQITAKVTRYPVTDVRYARHTKPGAPDIIRADYFSGLRKVAAEWVCLDHPGFAGEKARQWWARRAPREFLPGSVDQALEWIRTGYVLRTPLEITVNESGRWPEIIGSTWDESSTSGSEAGNAAARTAAPEVGGIHLHPMRELRPTDEDLQRVL